MSEDDWMQLFAARRPALVDHARRITGDVADAEDVVQDAWLKLRDDTPDVPAAWLATLVRNLALDRRRQRDAVRRLTDRLAAEPFPGVRAVDDDVDLRRAASVAFARMATLLTEVDVVLLVLREVFGEDFAALARLSGRSVGALRVAAHRALARLRATRDDDGPATPRAERTFAICWHALETRDATLLRAVLVDACRASSIDVAMTAPAVRMVAVDVDGRFRLGLRQGGRLLGLLPVGAERTPSTMPA